jgi:hypothetical protein
VFALFAGKFLSVIGNAVEVAPAVLKISQDMLPQEAARQVSQLGDGFVMRPAVTRDINRPHAAEVLEIFQALAGGTLAEVQAFDERVHGQGARSDKEQAVNFRHGAGLAEGARELDEEMDDLHLDGIQLRAGRILTGGLFQLFSERQIHPVIIAERLICSTKNEQKIHIEPFIR